MPQPCNLYGIYMDIQEENSACYFQVQSEREQTLVFGYRIAGIFSGYKFSRIKGEASFRDSYFHDN